MSAHAKLSASGASRWMNCPRSVALEQLLPESTSAYAEEGTRAHDAAERILSCLLKGDNAMAVEFIKDLETKDSEMAYHVGEYVDHCMELYEEAIMTSKDVVAYTEERLNYSKWVPGGFGTGDFVMLYKNKLIVRDLKYGKGVPVKATNNPQLRLYALGALDEYGWIYDIDIIETGIVQPRLHSIELEVISKKELLKWAERQVVKKAEMADQDCGELVSGDHCKFCNARALCKHRAKSILGTLEKILGGISDGNK